MTNQIQTEIQPQLRAGINFRIKELMAAHNIRSVAALQRILISRKVDISNAQLRRIVDNRTDSWKVEHINAFLELFQCDIAELFKVVSNEEADSFSSNSRQIT